MINVESLNLASISWGVLVIAFALMIIAGKVKFKK